ncbi:MAG TPA: hypothetical protein PL171_06165, partial [Anaerolineaceae bacterium]|nr:hypothetical protein [Anaerolineaceae bacterium]
MRTGLIRLILVCLLLVVVGALSTSLFYKPLGREGFNAGRAYQDVLFQTALGPRVPGSQAHEKVIQYFIQELKRAGWQVTLQRGERLGHSATNILASRGTLQPRVIVGAHYDSRMTADR